MHIPFPSNCPSFSHLFPLFYAIIFTRFSETLSFVLVSSLSFFDEFKKKLDPKDTVWMGPNLELTRHHIWSPLSLGLQFTLNLNVNFFPCSVSQDMLPGLTLRRLYGRDPTLNLPDITSEVPFHLDFSSLWIFVIFFLCSVSQDMKPGLTLRTLYGWDPTLN